MAQRKKPARQKAVRRRPIITDHERMQRQIEGLLFALGCYAWRFEALEQRVRDVETWDV
jgi:hypothetical protein